METCLMLKTKDKRRFFTNEENLDLIQEFSRTFNAEVFLVEAENVKPLSMKKLALAICNPDYSHDAEYRVTRKLLPQRTRKDILKQADKIQKFINRRLKSGKSLSLKELKNKYAETGVTDTCLCNHFTLARKQLAENGQRFKKLGAGKYCLVD